MSKKQITEIFNLDRHSCAMLGAEAERQGTSDEEVLRALLAQALRRRDEVLIRHEGAFTPGGRPPAPTNGQPLNDTN